jgi:hypothetical protein
MEDFCRVKDRERGVYNAQTNFSHFNEDTTDRASGLQHQPEAQEHLGSLERRARFTEVGHACAHPHAVSHLASCRDSYAVAVADFRPSGFLDLTGAAVLLARVSSPKPRAVHTAFFLNRTS